MPITKVSLEFAFKELADLWVGWYLDGGGEQEFYDVAEQEGIEETRFAVVEFDGKRWNG